MPLKYGGITPTLLFETSDLQSTEKLSKVGNKFVKNQGGVCMSMVMDWIEKSSRSTAGVTSKSELKSGLSLSLMHSAYRLDTFSDKGTSDKDFIESLGMTVTSEKTRTKSRFSFQKTRYERVAVALGGITGFAIINIFGDGGHALGYRQQGGTVQFFDPNEGVMQFTSSASFAKFFPPFIVAKYPHLRDSIKLTRVQV